MTDAEKESVPQAVAEGLGVVAGVNDTEREEGEISAETTLPKTGGEPDKHPLEHAWTFWFDNPNNKSKSTATWGSSLRPVYTFKTVEDFWWMEFNRNGRTLNVRREEERKHAQTNWESRLRHLLAMIGAQFDEYDEICGAVVSARPRQTKIALWTKTASNETAQALLAHAGVQVSIGKQWKNILDINEEIGYIVHEDAKRLDKNAKNRYVA